MKITTVSRDRGYEGISGFEVTIETHEGKQHISAYDMCECPEDAIMDRGLGFIYDVPHMLKLAYEAGKSGEEFLLVEETDDE